VLDARAVEGAIGDEPLPGCRARGALTDDDVDRFNDGYARAWGDRGTERDHDWRVRHGDDELRFGGARRPGAGGLAGGLAAGAAAGAAGLSGRPAADVRPTDVRTNDVRTAELRAAELRADEPWDGGRTVADRPLDRDRLDRDRLDEPRRLMDTSGPLAMPSPQPPQAQGAHFEESRRIDATLAPLDAERRGSAMDDTRDRRLDRVDDAGALPADRSIEPRELDARVRLDEGATVDDRTPVAGVRYEGSHEPHDYGRPDERYGAEYGSGRIGFDRVGDAPARGATTPRAPRRGRASRRPRATRSPTAARSPAAASPAAAWPAAASPAAAWPGASGRRPATPATRRARRRTTSRVTPRRATCATATTTATSRSASGCARGSTGCAATTAPTPTARRAARRVRYRSYDDRYDPGAPGR
jgi:hypothetical protein